MEGVAALNLGGTIVRSNFFDCETSTGSPDDLAWIKRDERLRFPTQLIEGRRRLNMNFSSRVRPNDAGVYVCVLVEPLETLPIRMVAGE